MQARLLLPCGPEDYHVVGNACDRSLQVSWGTTEYVVESLAVKRVLVDTALTHAGVFSITP